MKQPRGLILGWYNKLNAGDDRLATCISYWLWDHQLLFMPHTSLPTNEILESVDYVLLGGGSIANQPAGVFLNMHNWIQKARIPVFCAGLGVSQFAEFHKDFTAIKESGGHIWVRDGASAVNCGQPADSIDVAPDLSWLRPLRFPDLPRHGTAVNLRPGGGPRVLDLQKWKASLWAVPAPKPWPLCFGQDDDRQMLDSLFGKSSTTEEFDPTGAARAEILVAMRFHAVIFAIQTGTPFVAITHTRKLEHLLNAADLSYATVPYDRPDQFEQVFEAVKQHMTSESLLNLSDSISQTATEYAAQFKERIEVSVASNTRRTTLGFRMKKRLRTTLTRWTT